MFHRIPTAIPALAMATLLASAAAPPVHAQAAKQAQAGSQAQSKLAAADQQFMKTLGAGNLAEIETGKLAETKAGSSDIKSFGAQMVEDHGKALKDLQTLATSKGVDLPAGPDAKHASAAKSLAAASGQDFDRRYASMAVTDHEETLALLKKVQANAKDEDLRKLAGEMVPVVSGHLEHARKLPRAGK